MGEPRQRVVAARALRVCVAVVAAWALVVSFSAPAVAAKSAKKPKSGSTTSAPTLAQLKIIQPSVTIRAAGKTKYVKAKTGQVLRQGDALTTDTAGVAEIDYTDGSLTRLSPSTKFKITVLTNKRGGRQTQGTLTVGDTWSRAAKVAQTGSFEVKAGGATAAVEGTAFAMSCSKQNGILVCKVIDVVDDVHVSTTGGALTQLTPATSVDITNNTAGSVITLTYDDLANNPLIVGNLYLDSVGGKGLGIEDLPTTTTTTTTTQPPPRPTGTTSPPPPEPTTQPTLPPPPPPPPPPPTTVPLPTTIPCNHQPC